MKKSFFTFDNVDDKSQIMENCYAVGIMSGTSLDGVDVVYVEFAENNAFTILKAATIAYPSKWYQELKNVALLEKGSDKLVFLNKELGKYYGSLVVKFIKEQDIKKVDFIASHGHTVHHQPQEKYTLQIGCGQEIFNGTGVKTVYDFRTQDVLLGGQGAPLVPIGDELLFSEYDYCLNLGGFSNVSYAEDGIRKAFDICPVNTVLNFYANQLNLDYDDKGGVAKSGTLCKELLNELNALEFYKTTKPKSLGVEFLKETVYPILSAYSLPIKDMLRTFVEHIAVQITQKLKQGTVLVTGGGAYHTFLLDRICALSKDIELVIPRPDLIDYKEALVFALLGKLKIENKVNCLKSVTGAVEDHSSGIVISN